MSLWRCFWKHWWITLPLLLLLWGAMHWLGGKKDSIPTDVKERVINQLSGAGYNSIDVDVDGREVTLKGVASSEEVKSEILSVARSTVGEKGHIAPNSVSWAGEIKAPEPPKPIVLKDASLNANVKDGVVTLSGTLANQQQIDAVLASAYAKFGGKDNVINRLSLGENIKSVNGLNNLLKGLDMNDGSLNLSGSNVSLRGEVDAESTKSSIFNSVRQALGSTYSVRNLLTVAKPEPVVPAQNLVCQNELGNVMSQSKIYFETSSAVIKDNSYSLLNNVANILSKCPDASITVQGHTDSSGDESMNLDLSKRRATSVVTYLVGRGVSEQNLSSEGFGESKPVASNEDREGRAKNRRIEFTVK